MIKKLTLSMLLLAQLCGASAFAETLYIKDSLRWALRAEPNKSSQSLRLVSSGMTVKKLDEKDGYTQIEIDGGHVGWVSSSNLVTEKTNNILLEETNTQLTTLQDELTALKNTSPVGELEEKLAVAEQTQQTLRESLASEKEKVKTLRDKLNPPSEALSPAQQKIVGVGITALCLFLIGFILGKRMVEKKVRAKFNGMKVW